MVEKFFSVEVRFHQGIKGATDIYVKKEEI